MKNCIDVFNEVINTKDPELNYKLNSIVVIDFENFNAACKKSVRNEKVRSIHMLVNHSTYKSLYLMEIDE